MERADRRKLQDNRNHRPAPPPPNCPTPNTLRVRWALLSASEEALSPSRLPAAPGSHQLPVAAPGSLRETSRVPVPRPALGRPVPGTPLAHVLRCQPTERLESPLYRRHPV
ncbi:unnamed protein product [Rangifer tarandus platyrhynchus]|uniref:Uncharacterized protein n=2 Tax=Rangifer tarandus platyrhynchus TaxID=3082113 RepID=A0ACB0E006_RANTA|nr:unnamed protein product [Rangifer tarandus platyrhynchus]CAI9693774.1 unnamed protein product [Rangifer tarandus platyrhynchus]